MPRAGRTVLRTAGIAALLILLLVATHTWWLTLMGRFLIQAEPPAKADIIVVLAGDWMGNRILRAGELVREGYAPRALVDGPRSHYGLREYELAIPFAVRHGYPESYFEPLPVDGDSTREEAGQVMEQLRRMGVHSVLVVTSDYHTRRAGGFFRAAAGDIQIRMVAAPDTWFRADGWWKTRQGQKTAFFEWVKTVTEVFGL